MANKILLSIPDRTHSKKQTNHASGFFVEPRRSPAGSVGQSFSPHTEETGWSRSLVPRVAFRIDPMRAKSERMANDSPQRFTGIALPLAVLVDDMADLSGAKVSLSAVDIADDLCTLLQFHRVKRVRAEAGFQLLPTVFAGDVRVFFKLFLLP